MGYTGKKPTKAREEDKVQYAKSRKKKLLKLKSTSGTHEKEEISSNGMMM